jgi:hypothetical protein
LDELILRVALAVQIVTAKVDLLAIIGEGYLSGGARI